MIILIGITQGKKQAMKVGLIFGICLDVYFGRSFGFNALMLHHALTDLLTIASSKDSRPQELKSIAEFSLI